jgi:4-amino-4-deoxy-L-arabinose transferase-like glycosyltransferase
LAVSPWHLQISRAGAPDALFALFFYLFAIYLFTNKEKKGSVLWSLPFFLLGFYSYHATKIYFIFVIPLLVIIFWHDLLKRKKEIYLFLIGIAAILISFLYITMTQQVTRQSVLIINDTNSAKTVNWEREKNTAPFIIRQILSNKPLYFLRIMRENYLEAFSTNFLFLYGETGGLGGVLGLFNRGVLYIIELPLLLFGIFYLIKQKDKKTKILIICLLLIAPLPTTFAVDKQYVGRGIMMLPILSIIIGSGIYSFLQTIQAQRKTIRNLGIGLFIIIYSFLITGYLYQYYFRYTVYGAESMFRSSKDLSLFVGQNKSHYDNVYIAGDRGMLLLQYGVFNKIDPVIMQKAWEEPWPKKIGNVTFLQECFDKGADSYNPKTMLPYKTMYIVPDNCHKIALTDYKIKDLGEPLRTIWKIYEK